MSQIRLLALLVAMLAAGCASESSTPSSTVPPVTAPPTTVVPTTTTESALFPVEVTTDQGSVEIMAMPERIVSLSATHTEIIYELGLEDRLVAVDLTSNYPPEVASKPQIDSFNFNVEEVAALDPDLVIVAFDFQGEPEALDALGIPFLLLGPPTNLDGMYEQFRAMGHALGVPESGEALAAKAEQFALSIGPETESIAGQTFFHEVDNTYYTAASSSFLGDLYASLGLVNIADAASVDPDNPFPQLSAEFIIDQDPDFIFLGDAAFGESAETVAARPGWEALSAIDAQRIVEIDADISGRWGPRTIDLMADILDAVLSAV